jgi:hypothetical protein
LKRCCDSLSRLQNQGAPAEDWRELDVERLRRHRLVAAVPGLLILVACGSASDQSQSSTGGDEKLIAAVTQEGLPSDLGPDTAGRLLSSRFSRMVS